MARDETVLPLSGLLPAELEALRPFVVDLENGHFSGLPGASGHAELKTVPADVDTIFSTHLPAFAASRGGGAVPVVFWAHGGLVSEGSALTAAQRNIPWWLANGIYPIHFVWHTGFWDSLGDLVADHAREIWTPTAANKSMGAAAASLTGVPSVASGRGLNSPVTDSSNKLIEELLRHVGGMAIWAAMKENALKASEPGGGAAYVAAAMAAFQSHNPGTATVHAAGFSAGANFQEHFVPAVVRNGGAIDTCTLLVPAVGTEEFKRTLLPLLGQGVGRIAVFGMKTVLAREDNCFGIYRGSLLDLIRAALDPTPGTPILGLQQCIGEDTVLNALFKVYPETGPAESVWSVTCDGALDARSAATTHSAFDDDVPTMDSVVRRITGRKSIVSFGTTAHAGLLAVAAKNAL